MVKSTEDAGQRYRGLDTWGTHDILEALWDGQMRAVSACLSALPALSRAVDAAVLRLRQGGKLVYVGAGSSGIIAALDGLDLGPTFDWPSERLVVLLASGLDLRQGLEGNIEDDAGIGAERLRATIPGENDVVVGISASGRSAFTVAALLEARERGALSIGVASVDDGPLTSVVEIPVVAPTGDEVICGSTRLGAGTAQKVILNLFSSAVMIRLGYVYDNLMVSVRPENAKLRKRAATIVREIAGCSEAEASVALERYKDVKVAILALAGMDEETARASLADNNGVLRAALDVLRGSGKP